MDVKTAAIQVSQQAGTALHAKDIAEKIMADGLWQSKGKTPSWPIKALSTSWKLISDSTPKSIGQVI